MNDKNKHAVALGTKGGKSTSEKKRKASRENGKLGGRPKKQREEVSDANHKGCSRMRIGGKA